MYILQWKFHYLYIVRNDKITWPQYVWTNFLGHFVHPLLWWNENCTIPIHHDIYCHFNVVTFCIWINYGPPCNDMIFRFKRQLARGSNLFTRHCQICIPHKSLINKSITLDSLTFIFSNVTPSTFLSSFAMSTFTNPSELLGQYTHRTCNLMD